MPISPVTRWAWLPAQNSWKYHLLLAATGIFLLGPLAGVTAAYMNFSLGFFVGGQVLAGLLGSTVTAGYGADGKHGANYIQTAAASVASMSGMGVLIQAMVWMGLPQPPAWQLVAYMLCIGMFGAGVGMLYTPVLVDRMQLTFPSGLAVANILRALTDPALLRQSVGKLGGGLAAGLALGLAAIRVPVLGAIELSASTFGAGMVVGARIGIPVVTGGLDQLGAAAVLRGYRLARTRRPVPQDHVPDRAGHHHGRRRGRSGHDLLAHGPRHPASGERERQRRKQDWKRVHSARLLLWIGVWGAGIVFTGHAVLGQPVGYLLLAVALVFVFALVNGISVGVSDSNPISSAFVVAVVLMAAIGLRDPGVGLMAGTVLLVSTSVACDMQQDRSTGWRLGSNRVLQFRYQVVGILMGAVLAVAFAKLFMAAYPVLLQDQTVMKADQQPAEWSAAMTYKFVGVLRSLTDDKPFQRIAIGVGIAIGMALEGLRKLIMSRAAYRRLVAGGRRGQAIDFAVDAVLLPSPYALSFGGFVNLPTSLWFGAGSVVSSLLEATGADQARRDRSLPPDMSGTSLFGGGLIAGDALAALGLGTAGLLAALALP